ncbi:hypothetical protein [Amycolatopsis plumensis]|uniref:hypothetical protein n=1 Tax=Amycolatopsis plumensis TaxID=236508 RepID=UPI00360B8C17
MIEFVERDTRDLEIVGHKAFCQPVVELDGGQVESTRRGRRHGEVRGDVGLRSLLLQRARHHRSRPSMRSRTPTYSARLLRRAGDVPRGGAGAGEGVKVLLLGRQHHIGLRTGAGELHRHEDSFRTGADRGHPLPVDPRRGENVADCGNFVRTQRRLEDIDHAVRLPGHEPVDPVLRVCARAFGKVVFPNASRDPSRTRVVDASSARRPRAERMSRDAQSERQIEVMTERERSLWTFLIGLVRADSAAVRPIASPM